MELFVCLITCPMFTIERAKSPLYVYESEGEGPMPSLPDLNSVGLLRSNKSGKHRINIKSS